MRRGGLLTSGCQSATAIQTYETMNRCHPVQTWTMEPTMTKGETTPGRVPLRPSLPPCAATTFRLTNHDAVASHRFSPSSPRRDCSRGLLSRSPTLVPSPGATPDRRPSALPTLEHHYYATDAPPRSGSTTWPMGPPRLASAFKGVRFRSPSSTTVEPSSRYRLRRQRRATARCCST